MKNRLLFRRLEEEYCESFKSHYLEIYKIYVETTDKISDRRYFSNSFFLSINTAIVGFVSYLDTSSNSNEKFLFHIVIGLVGTITSYMWYRLIVSYRQINTEKFKIIQLIEEELPIAPYSAEWEFLGKGKDSSKYVPFTHVEVIVPWIFIGLHSCYTLYLLFSLVNEWIYLHWLRPHLYKIRSETKKEILLKWWFFHSLEK